MGVLGIVTTARTRWAGILLSAPIGLRRLAGSVSVTLVGQGILLCGLFLITRVSIAAFGAVGFGEYQVARRTLAVMSFPLMCGVGVSMPRYIARNIGDRREVATWLFSGGVLAAILIVVFLALGTWCSSEIGRWTFGIGGGQRLVLSLLLAVAGQLCGTLAYAALRGLSRFRAAAVFQIVNGAVAPLVGVLLAGGRVERALAIAGGLWIAMGGTVFLRLCREWGRPAPSGLAIREAIRALFIFGVPRVPGEVALFGLFALPAYAAVHRNDIVGAGFLSVGLSLVQAIATVFAATGFVLLPYWSRAMKAADSRRIARKRVAVLLVASAVVTVLGLLLLQAFLMPIARLLLGPLAEAGLNDIRYVTFGAVPYVIYMVLRDYFDAISVFPLNTVALTVAIALQAALLSGRWLSVSVATACSFGALGLLMTGLWAVSMCRSGAAEKPYPTSDPLTS